MNAPAVLPVVLVDDDDASRLGCCQALRLAGFDVIPAASAEAPLGALTRPAHIGALVTDMQLPLMNGLQLIRNIQLIDASLPSILITGHSQLGLASEAMRCGAFDFIAKPFAPGLLIRVVARALDHRRAVVEGGPCPADITELMQTPALRELGHAALHGGTLRISLPKAGR